MKAVKGTVRKYYKYESWTQPVFTSATTWGNVTADNWYDEPNFHEYPYMALDGETTGTQTNYAAANGVTSVNWYWQFAEPLSISKIKMWNRNQGDTYGGATTYTIYGLNADSTYTQIGTISVAAQAWATGETNISNSDMFYGLKIYCQGTKSNVGIGELLLTASTVISGTSSDYDFYKDVNVPKLVIDSFAKKANVLKVGNIVDNNGIISGFSATNYATLPKSFEFGSGTWEICIKFKSYENTDYHQDILRLKTTNNDKALTIRKYSNSVTTYPNCLFMELLNASFSPSQDIVHYSNYTITNNRYYWVKFAYDGSRYTLSTSTNGSTYNTRRSKDASSALTTTESLTGYLGFYDSSNYLNGDIDLNESYIKKDGVIWWSGTVTAKKYYGINI